jgi:hypothetical protein
MRDRDYGWTAEMQAKAARAGIRCAEVPVSYHRRIGRSKITGTVRGTVMAGYKILTTIVKVRLEAVNGSAARAVPGERARKSHA